MGKDIIKKDDLQRENGIAEEHGMFNLIIVTVRKLIYSPGWRGSVDWVLACKPRGRWFNSQSEHMPGMQARPPVGAHERQPHIDISLPLFKKKKTQQLIYNHIIKTAKVWQYQVLII